MQTLVLPKIHSAEDLHHVSRQIYATNKETPRNPPLNIVSSVESARASWNLGSIAQWKSEYGSELGGRLTALLVSTP